MSTRIKGVKNVPHVVGTGTNAIILTLPDVYQSVGAACGVNKLVGQAPDGVIATEVGDAIKVGLVRKIKISYLDAGKRKTSELIVSSDKMKTARGTLPTQNFRGFDIITAYYPTRRRLG